MIKRFLVLFVAILIITPLFAEGNKEGGAETQKVYTTRFSHGLPPTHPWAKTLDEFARLVEQKSDGQIKVKVYPSGQLYKPNKLYEAIKTGLVEGGSLFTVYLQANIPIFNALSPTGTVWNQEIESEIIREYLKKEGPGWELAKAMEANGLKPLAWFSTGSAGLYSGLIGKGKPIVKPEDMVGKKMRSLGPLNTKAIETWGGRPVFLSGSDLYTGLQRGTIDVTYGTPSHLLNRKLCEVTDYYVAGVPAAALQQIHVIVSMKFFNSLPSNLQNALIDAGREITSKCLDPNYKFNPYREAKELYQKLKEKDGFKVIELDKGQLDLWAKSCETLHEKRMKEIGPEAVKIYNMVSELEKKYGLPYYFIK